MTHRPNTHCIVVRPFGPYRTGDVISDDEAVAKLSAEELACVVRVQPPQEI